MKKTNILMLSLVTLVFQNNSLLSKAEITQTEISVKELEKKASPKNTLKSTGKVLECTQMDLLNSAFTANPIAVLKINMARKTLRTVFKKICDEEEKEKNQKTRTILSPKEEKAFVQKQVEIMLLPVKEFFDSLIKYRGMVRPVLELSLESQPEEKGTSFLIKCCDAQKDIFTFCEKEINTKKNLKLICAEISQFFNDLNTSLKQPAKDSYHAFVKELKAKKKKKKNKK